MITITIEADVLEELVNELDWLQREEGKSEIAWAVMESIQNQAPAEYWDMDEGETVTFELTDEHAAIVEPILAGLDDGEDSGEPERTAHDFTEALVKLLQTAEAEIELGVGEIKRVELGNDSDRVTDDATLVLMLADGAKYRLLVEAEVNR